MRPLNNINQIASRYYFLAMAIGLFLPKVGLVRWLGIDAPSMPIYSWIAGIPGSLAFYPDYFLIMAAMLPFWLLLYGRFYVRHYSSRNVNLLVLLPMSLIALLVVAAIALARVDPLGNDSIQRWDAMLIMAARSRVFGALLFGAVHLFIFVLLSIALVKTPIDVMRRVISQN